METPTCCRSKITMSESNISCVARPAKRPAAIAESGVIESAVFQAASATVGTDSPYHSEDGEGPRRLVQLGRFELETFPVTNARFASFVEATGHVTVAETFGWAAVFNAVEAPDDAYGWRPVLGACWFSPEGNCSSIDNRLDHPVVQICLSDAMAFAAWAGGRLPSEAEWEHAARGGKEDPRFPWGDEEPDDERIMCNIWQGAFPRENTLRDGYLSTNPAGAFPANGAGLYDMAGNVWEWTADPFRSYCVGDAARRRNAAAAVGKEGLLKGGSFLCHRSYCYRYRIVARLALRADSCGNNVGFRVAYDR